MTHISCNPIHREQVFSSLGLTIYPADYWVQRTRDSEDSVHLLEYLSLSKARNFTFPSCPQNTEPCHYSEQIQTSATVNPNKSWSCNSYLK